MTTAVFIFHGRFWFEGVVVACSKIIHCCSAKLLYVTHSFREMCFWIDADQLFIADAVCSIPFDADANKAKTIHVIEDEKSSVLLLELIWIWLVMRFEIHEIRKRLNYGSKLRSSRSKKWLSSEMDCEFMISSIYTLERKLLFYLLIRSKQESWIS